MNTPGIEYLLFFKSLRVGDLVVEPKRVKASYVLTLQSGEALQKELIYSYTESVFQKTAESVNMASMIVAQAALNYGLFCEEIIFDGLYDEADRRFLLDMMENTSREIYVNKFLMPNEFIVPPYNRLPAERRKRYTGSRVLFQNTRFNGMSLDWKHIDADREKYVILSSGGKDSLLSYGLLKELNKEVIPVFINESGRHWFTAINAYKSLSGSDPNCRKVWCNSDRIYNWMLRQMPCIRKDFSDVRADIYPVRLWTVGVFIFGALPIVRKMGAGNVIIGNEYDTTMKTAHEGVTHYQALYDQSKYFDNALTRYYTKKGWNAFQFSILRSLSEILIMKILAKRYPELQTQQVSCHAASIKGTRSYPCGKCEKCRRIVSMLSVLDESASTCGYTTDQISEAILKTGSSGVKQIDSDAQHLYFMLLQKKLIPKNSANASFAREHPYILKMRFDGKRSALNDMPLDLYKQLIPIFQEYTDGAVKRIKKQWIDMDISAEIEKSAPYPFEILVASGVKPDLTSGINWESYTWKEIEGKLEEVDTAILPCGSIEQHGPHLPLDVDYYDSMYLAKTVAEACSNPKPFVLPAIPYGVAYHHEDFKGTISISNNTLSMLVYDIGMSLVKNGIRKLIILNAHGDNAPTLLYAAQMINRESGIFVCVESGETSDTDLFDLIDTPNDIHAGEIETSTTLALRPEVVRMQEAVNETMNFGSTYLDFTSERGVAWYVRTKIISKSGIMGDPTKADSKKGKKLWEIMIAHLVRFVEEVKRSNPEDLYQRKY
jgi:creatinine amidohydrolase/Fe(II)-dependent formamide hydrolase-like protein/7-cyano-7-deazaguanine synthase in queuosine biosynthesis